MKSSSISPQSVVSFKGYYDADKIKLFEKYLEYYKRANPYLKKTDISTMRNSISSYNAFLKGAETINPVNVENQIYKKMGIPAHFDNDKHLASMVALALNIFKKLNFVLPTSIKKGPLEYGTRAICSTKDRSVIFSSLEDWSNTQESQIMERFENHTSTGHFLRTPIHEFMHSVHIAQLNKLAYIKEKVTENAYGKWLSMVLKIPDFKTEMANDAGTPFKEGNAMQYIIQHVSGYGATRPCEMFADKGAQMIADSLDFKTILPKHNPFVLKNFTEDKYINKMLDDFWMGNFSKYIQEEKSK